MSFLFLITWEIVQSKYVAEKTSEIITKYANRYLGAKAEFRDLNFKLFPPGVEIEDVSFKLAKNAEVELKSGRIGAYFNFKDLFSTTFMISEIGASDIELKVRTRKSGKEKIGIEQTLAEVIKNAKKIPIRRVSLSNIKSNINQMEFSALNLKILKGSRGIRINGIFSELSGIDKRLSRVDSVSLDLSIISSGIFVNTLSVWSGLSRVQLKGEISNLNKSIIYKIRGKYTAPIQKIHEFIDFKNIGKLERGNISGEFKLNGKASKYNLVAAINSEELETSFIRAKKLNAQIHVNPQFVSVQDLEVQDDNGGVGSIKKAVIYDIKEKKLLPLPIEVEMKEYSSLSFLNYINKNIEFLELAATGNVLFNYSKNQYSFKTKNNFLVDHLYIKANDKKLLGFHGLNTENLLVNIKRGEVGIEFNGSKEEEKFSLVGEISKDGVDINIELDNANLENIRPFFGEDLKGRASTSLNINNKDGVKLVGPLKVTDIVFDEKFFVEEIKGSLSLDLEDNVLNVNKIQLNQDGARGIAELVVNLDKNDLNLKYQVKGFSYDSLRLTSKELLSNIDKELSALTGPLSFEGELSVDFLKKTYLAKGFGVGESVIYQKELINEISSDYIITRDKVELKNISVQKGEGKVQGDVFIEGERVTFAFDIQKVPLHESSHYSKIPLDLSMNATGKIEGNVKAKELEFKTDLHLFDIRTIKDSYRNTHFSLEYKKSHLDLTANIFDEEILLDLSFNFKDSKKSKAKLKTNISNLDSFLKIFTGVDKFEESFTGLVRLEAETSFDWKKELITDLNLNIADLKIQKNELNLNYTNLKPEIIVENGLVKKWEVKLEDEKNYIRSNGKGNLKSEFEVKSYLKLDASILEIFNQYIAKSSGTLRSKVVWSDTQELKRIDFLSTGLTVDTKKFPLRFSDGNLRLSYYDRNIELTEGKVKLGGGEISTKGAISFENIFPKLDFSAKFENSVIPIMNKSELIFSGESRLSGENFPYDLSGNLYIKKFNISNEFTDFRPKGTRGVEKTRFLPGKTKRRENQLLAMNINVQTQEPIYIKNSLADIGFEGLLDLTGGEKEFYLDGKVGLFPRKNIIKIKNNEFLIQKADVFFNKDGNAVNPDLDFLASSSINSYRVSVKAVGPVNNPNIIFSSDPFLSQSDILSLIAFGYTEDISQNLSSREREALTQAGVGSIIFDSFKINKTLQKEFGLQINLGTEVTEEEKSYLSQRNADTGGDESRVKTLTSLEIQKKVTEKVNVSVSSSVGTSTTQKQTMNLNYNMTENISLEGIYESKSDDDAESPDDTSVGADIKWRWSFK